MVLSISRGLVRCSLLTVHLTPAPSSPTALKPGNLIYKYLPLLNDFDPLSRDGSKRCKAESFLICHREVGGKNDRGTEVFKKGGRTFSQELCTQLIHGSQ